MVRDGLVEADDPPPERPIDGPLTPAPTDAVRAGGSDLRRADESENADPSAYLDAALNTIGQVFPTT